MLKRNRNNFRFKVEDEMSWIIIGEIIMKEIIRKKKSYFVWILGIVISSVGICGLIFKFLWSSYTTEFISNLLTVLGLLAFWGLLFSIISISDVRKYNRIIELNAYNFDFKSELQRYKRIGNNKVYKRKSFEKIDKYSDWKKIIENDYDIQKNNEDFYHFCIRIFNAKRDFLEITKVLIVPSEIAIITILFSTRSSELRDPLTILIVITVLIGFIVLYLTIEIEKANIEKDFLKDFMKIVFPNYYDI